MENEPDHENVEQSFCAKTTDEELNKSFNLEASLSKFSYIDLDKELEFKNDLMPKPFNGSFLERAVRLMIRNLIFLKLILLQHWKAY
uniref:Uncharacterized protein n=1 Tax=Sus scrofa TaxID=9823 RepID=A0A4X1UL69_PIG